MLRSEQRAEVDGPNVQAGSVTVVSNLNTNDRVTSSAELLTGGGALFEAKANVAVAYGRSSSIALFRPATLVSTAR